MRLLPVWDAYLMGYAKGAVARSRLVIESNYARIYDRAGNATSVVLVDGLAAGVWEFDFAASTRKLSVRIAPFGSETTSRWAEIEEAAHRIAFAIEASECQIERAPEPGPLADGARNAVLAPIRLGRSV